MCPTPRRKQAWERLVNDLPDNALQSIAHVVALEEIPRLAEEITTGQVQGRVIVDLNASN